uniref:NADH dehydrogenase subunit 3 n=1 Tax=Skeletonema subsalsum TaxID=216763 RepID=UPI001D0F7C23|nr:NADH dehydrogenase subunit 3 [Skeletonema subsalsum]YP_010208920.1 NADH dehydrogenase subunit 3 [Skeletonema potamos]UBA16191.1 NADH dehydrogenase subunit 3 [Skeletonema subsalsum]UBA16230.1 NADH dehydrogenase subunit 3 [Skeletonema potamos]
MIPSIFPSKSFPCLNQLLICSDYFHLNASLFYNEYSVILTFLFVATVLSVVIVLFSYILAVQNPETEKLSTYECGFEPYEDARHTFDVKFYLVAILFIVFDIETMFLIPWTNVLGQLDLVGFWSMIDFMFELGIGYVYIYCIGALDIH